MDSVQVTSSDAMDETAWMRTFAFEGMTMAEPEPPLAKHGGGQTLTFDKTRT
ncbi:MAG: hypothetical protein HY280_00095 [Nitrospinae bacterium]|nr:hypothetical protein [Nitrospinota bacterium]